MRSYRPHHVFLGVLVSWIAPATVTPWPSPSPPHPPTNSTVVVVAPHVIPQDLYMSAGERLRPRCHSGSCTEPRQRTQFFLLHVLTTPVLSPARHRGAHQAHPRGLLRGSTLPPRPQGHPCGGPLRVVGRNFAGAGRLQAGAPAGRGRARHRHPLHARHHLAFTRGSPRIMRLRSWSSAGTARLWTCDRCGCTRTPS